MAADAGADRVKRWSMSLRFQLVAGLIVLVAVGVGLLALATYELYSTTQYDQLDNELHHAVPLVAGQLAGSGRAVPAGGGSGSSSCPGAPPGGPEGGLGPGPSGEGGSEPGPLPPPGTYGALVSATGKLECHIQLGPATPRPALPSPLPSTTGGPAIFTTGSVQGPVTWRVLISRPQANGDRVVAAVPMTGVTNSLNTLVLIEVIGGLVLLAVLSVGAWLLLRRGLAPLEDMAATAGTIAAGDLTPRVEPVRHSTEVDQLGQAFNTMLDGIEAAFVERDATEARLRQFLADASHELRTPLTSIQGFAELSRLGAEHPQVDAATIMRRIEAESERMKALVEDLLLLARLDQVRPSENRPVDLSVLAADACSDAVAADPDRRVTLGAPEPVVIAGDEGHLRQAVGNLVANAVRHTPLGSPIEVTTELAGDEGRLVVRDHGPGLDEEGLAHVFDRFWRKDPARVGSGSGLGLSITAAVVAEHGGTVSAGNAPGGGAMFVIRLPRQPAPALTEGTR